MVIKGQLLKHEAHDPHHTPEQQLLGTFYFIAYGISILNFDPLSRDPVLVLALWLALTI